MSDPALPISGTEPSAVLLANPDLHQANTAAMPPASPKALSWWRRIFQSARSEPVLVEVRKGRDETGYAAIYQETHAKTGERRYFLRWRCSDSWIDGPAYEYNRAIVYVP